MCHLSKWEKSSWLLFSQFFWLRERKRFSRIYFFFTPALVYLVNSSVTFSRATDGETNNLLVNEFKNNTNSAVPLARDDFFQWRSSTSKSSDLWNFFLDSRKDRKNYSIAGIIHRSRADLKLRKIHKLTRFYSSLWQLNTRRQSDSDERKRSLPIGIDRGRLTDRSAISFSLSLPLLSCRWKRSLMQLIWLSTQGPESLLDARSMQRAEKKKASHNNKKLRYYSFN